MAEIDDLRKFEYFEHKDLTYVFDPLTNVLNRQTVTDYITYLTANGREFSLFLVDVDNFKNVNDTYGHQVGDQVLAQTAQYLLQKATNKGVVARYGGDEFIMVFENMSLYDDVWKHGHEINMDIGKIVFTNTPNISITVSMGIARSPLDAKDYDSLLLVADRALYRAKTKGRNCFIIYLPEKHANIAVKDRGRNLTTMQIVTNLFKSVTANGEDVCIAISTVLRSLCSHYMYDHICIETRKGLNFSTSYILSKKYDFEHIDYRLLNNSMNASGYMCSNNIENLSASVYQEIRDEFGRQGISSTLCCTISAYGKNYGAIRIDTASTVRIWQNAEISMIMVVANVIGLLLHYQKKTLDELHLQEKVIVGEIEDSM